MTTASTLIVDDIRSMTGVVARPSAVLPEHREEVLDAAASRGGTDVRVFGSVARGEDRPGSDLDLLVDFPPETSLLTVIGLELELRELLGVAVWQSMSGRRTG
jgi:uncharacterized protein